MGVSETVKQGSSDALPNEIRDAGRAVKSGHRNPKRSQNTEHQSMHVGNRSEQVGPRKIKICNQQVVGSNPTAGSSFFHKDRAKKSLRRGRIPFGSHKLRNSWRFFNQPCVRVKMLLEVGQAPLSEILIARGIEKEVVRNINRRCRRRPLDFVGRSDLLFVRVAVGPVKGKEKNVARGRNTLRVEEQFRLSPKHEDALFG